MHGLSQANLVPAGSSNVLVSAAAMRRAGEFDVRLRHLDDWDMWTRLVQVTTVGTCEDALVAYVQHPDSKHVVERGALPQDAKLLRGLHRDSGLITRFDRGTFALFLADGHRQAGRHWRAAAVQALGGLRCGRPDYVRAAAAQLARSTGLLRRPPRAGPETPDWVRRQWAAPAEQPAGGLASSTACT